MIPRTLLLQLANSKKVETFVRKNGWSAKAARRFVAGETIEEEVAVVVDTYLRLFQSIQQESLNANVSLKLTALGLDIDNELCYRNMVRLLNAAGPDLFVRIDMEGTPHTQRTLDLFYRLWNGPDAFRNVGVVIQAYLRRSADDIEQLITTGVRVRLCKGAYKEPSELAFPDKAEVDANYI